MSPLLGVPVLRAVVVVLLVVAVVAVAPAHALPTAAPQQQQRGQDVVRGELVEGIWEKIT